MKHTNVLKRTRIAALSLALLFIAAAALAGCSAMNKKGEMDSNEGYLPHMDAQYAADAAREDERPDLQENERIRENQFVDTETEPTSTFSADVDTASYTYFRRLVNTGYSLSELTSTAGGALRTEEMVNYFKYDCPAPEGTLFGLKATAAPSPYNDFALLKLTLCTEKTEPAAKNNLVFLIDVSGSMASADKLDLLKKAFRYLTERLDGDDVVSIVTYSGKEEVVLEGCAGNKKEMILEKIDSLVASGSTNGEAGLKKAYEIAEKFRIEGGNNRIFMASDGDLNVGISSSEELKEFVSDKRKSGVYLSVLGFGYGNYRDASMEAIADNGNGVYMYVDGEREAEKIFGEDLFASLYTVAEDVKLQITFNKDVVKRYRLVGYENRVMSNEDFKNDTKDAGELGAGRQVTVFYELVLNEGIDFANLASYSTDRYDTLATLAVRYKAPGDVKSVEENHAIPSTVYTETPDADFAFAAAVVECSAILRNSEYKGRADLAHLDGLLSGMDLQSNEYKQEFKNLIRTLLTREQA